MKTARAGMLGLLLLLLMTPLALFGQEKSTDAQEKSRVESKKPQVGVVEFGARGTWGEVYGRPDLPFEPSLRTSKYEEYRYLRDGFFIPRARLNWDNVASKYFVDFQAAKAIYRDQSYLATFGEWNRFKIQFRYDEIPHIYTNTARTAMLQTAPGVWIAPATLRNTLQPISNLTSLPSTIQTQIVPGMTFITPQIIRRAGTMVLSYNFTPDLNLNFSFRREHESGARPIGLIFNSSPRIGECAEELL